MKLDNNFVYAIDHIAVCYRRLGEYKTAIKYYNKSLDIFPEGDIAIMNIAATYSFIKDDNNSIKTIDCLNTYIRTILRGTMDLLKCCL